MVQQLGRGLAALLTFLNLPRCVSRPPSTGTSMRTLDAHSVSAVKPQCLRRPSALQPTLTARLSHDFAKSVCPDRGLFFLMLLCTDLARSEILCRPVSRHQTLPVVSNAVCSLFRHATTTITLQTRTRFLSLAAQLPDLQPSEDKLDRALFF